MKLTVTNICKNFSHTKILNDVSFTVNDNEVLVILGPSGCGKSTLLNIIAGITDPDSGTIMLDEQDLCRLPMQKRNIAMVFQNYSLYPHLSVKDNLEFPLKVHKIPKEAIKEKVSQVTELLQITHLLDRMPNQLSGGQKQRVAIGRAIIRNPSIFLMDEPLSSLDTNLKIQLRQELKQIIRDLHAPTVYVTHDCLEAFAIASKIMILNEGKVAQIGIPEEIFERPGNLFVAKFLFAERLIILNGVSTEDLSQCEFVTGNLPQCQNKKTVCFDASKINLDKNIGVITEIVREDYYGQYYKTEHKMKINGSTHIIFTFTHEKLSGEKLSIPAESLLIYDENLATE